MPVPLPGGGRVGKERKGRGGFHRQTKRCHPPPNKNNSTESQFPSRQRARQERAIAGVCFSVKKKQKRNISAERVCFLNK